MSRRLTPYHLGGLAVLVILGIYHGSWLHALDEMVLTVVLTVLWFALRSLGRDLWRDWFLSGIEEGGGLEPPGDRSPAP